MAKFSILFLFVIYILYLICPIYGANILAVLPSVWKSHYIFGRRLLQQLVNVNNNITVTLIRPQFAFEEPPIPRITEIRVPGMHEKWIEMGISFNVEVAKRKTTVERLTRLIYAGTANVDLLLSNEQVRKLLKSEARFDLFLVDLFLSDSLLGLAYIYQAPTVVISPNGANPWLNYMLGNPQSSATDPSIFLPYDERMNVWERCINTLMGLFEKLTYNFFYVSAQESVFKKYFFSCPSLGITMPHHRELTQNISLVLINSHPILQYPRAYLPNMIEIGGAHLKTLPEMLLPKHLNLFIEQAPKGVIYMSLGANFRTIDLSHDKLETFLDVFTHLTGMRVLLKYESKYFEGGEQPKNVLINPWFPQEAILMHRNVKVFITTCGIMSVEEAINGVTPMLALPVLPNQVALAKRLQSQGVALMLPFNRITHSDVLETIEELACNDTYRVNLKRLRQILRANYNGNPITQTQNYIELIMNTSGADFLKSHANELNFIRAKLIDVLAIITIGICIIIAIPFLIICLILRKSYYTHVAQVQSLQQLTPSETSISSTEVLHLHHKYKQIEKPKFTSKIKTTPSTIPTPTTSAPKLKVHTPQPTPTPTPTPTTTGRQIFAYLRPTSLRRRD